MSDDPRQLAFSSVASADERFDAMTSMQKAYMPSATNAGLSQTATAFVEGLRDQYDMARMMAKARVIEMPGTPARNKDGGMTSIFLDKWQIFTAGEYFEKPAPAGFDTLRSMVEQTPILNAIVMTRIRQVQRFCSPQEDDGPGFVIRHVDRDHTLTASEKESIALLQRFVANCGWEFKPRQRKRLKRDNFAQFCAKYVRDSLTMDAGAIETEFKRDKRQGIDGFYAVDGATIRLCDEDGYDGDDQVFAVQVLQQRIVTAYTHDDLIYEPRNPRTDVRLAGYGLGETELLIRVVTGFLNAMTHNIKGLDENSIPRGLLHLSGDYSSDDLAAFRRYWNAMVRGVNNAWALPMLVSKDQESKASFENFGIEFNEMYFAKWMTFLASIACAIYGMSPAEINFDSFTGGNTSALAGSDTGEKLAASKDSGLMPLMANLQSTFSDFIIAEFSDKYAFRWTGLEAEDLDKRHEMKKLVLSVNEARAQEGFEATKESWGDAPLNPSLVGAWQQEQQAGQEDYGTMPQQDGTMPGQEGEQDAGQDNAPPSEIAQDAGAGAELGGAAGNGEEAAPGPRQGDFGKALRIWSVE